MREVRKVDNKEFMEILREMREDVEKDLPCRIGCFTATLRILQIERRELTQEQIIMVLDYLNL